MSEQADPLTLDDTALLDECEVDIYKATGPGGQHRNKVSSACRLRHRPTGITATAADCRSQHENRRLALRRLRMNLACRQRRPVDPHGGETPAVVGQCLSSPKAPTSSAARRLQIGRKDYRFWAVAAYLLDLLDANAGRLRPAADALGISTSNLASVLRSDRHLLASAQGIRQRHGHKRLQ